jgi:hypothetical protein
MKKEIIISLKVSERKDGEPIELIFSANSGIFGTREIIDRYTLKPERLLQILQDRDDYKFEEM